MGAEKQLLGIEEYAAHRGVALQAVQLAIKSGRIKISKIEGRKKLIDVEQADVDWEANTSKKRMPRSAKPQTFIEAQTAKEISLARIKELEVEQLEGILVNVEGVKAENFRIARTMRDAMLNISDRLAASCAAESNTHAVHKMIDDEIRKALECLADHLSDGQ